MGVSLAPGSDCEVEILLPVHNEAASIEATVTEIERVVSPVARFRFIVSEDGSTDDTPKVLQRLAENHLIKLISEPHRKGYSRAVIDGLRRVESPYVLCLDGDGQCDPRDFVRFWEARETSTVVVGWRVNRKDPPLRRALSGAFRIFHHVLFPVRLHDPSCPFVLAPKEVVEEVLPRLGVLAQGFWWEFSARVYAAGYRLKELPINHRTRAAGQTQVYRLSKMPGIGWSHFLGLVRIRLQP